MQETIDKVNNIMSAVVDKENLLHFLNHQLEKEKEQIKDAWQHGDSSVDAINSEQYYNQTYNQTP